MSKFKVGDKVKVRDDLICGEKYGNNTFVGNMRKLQGQIVTIERTGNYCYSILEDIYNWTDEMFEDEPINDEFETTKVIIDTNGITITKEEGEKEMKNEVLELWYERKRNEIEDKYDELVNKEYQEIEIVKDYNRIVDNFKNSIEELYNSEQNKNKQYIIDTEDRILKMRFIVNGNIVKKITENYSLEKEKEIYELLKTYNEIKALLSLSNDLTYQLDILTQYGIIDKKTKKMVD